MSTKIPLVQGDNLPLIRLQLRNEIDGSPLDVSGATVVVLFRAQGSATTLAALPCSPLTDGTDGQVTFFFPGETLSVPPGPYEGEVECDFGGLKQTVYRPLRFNVRAQFETPTT